MNETYMTLARSCDPSPFCKSLPVGSPEWDYFFGLESGIPVCCVLEFCYRVHMLGQENVALRVWGVSDKAVTTEQHYRILAIAGNYVPCKLHRKQIAAQIAAWAARRAFERTFPY